ncbi:hypothetical protein WN48_03964 [Eufriesea mexicana]|nr:hypothetical protein WN48_03964 [Eufriesea mexicana]
MEDNHVKPSNEYNSIQNWKSVDEHPKYQVSKILQLNRGLRLFENFQNLNHYPLNVIVFESLLMNVSYDDQDRLRLDKPDANVMFALEKAMKAKFLIKAMRKVDFTEDPFASSLKRIENGEVDMVITGFFVKVYNRFQKFQFTCAMYEDRLCFVTPDSGLVPKAYMPFLPFQKSLWAMLMVYNVLITLLWCLVKYASESFRRPDSIDHRLKINPSKREPRTKDLLSSRTRDYLPTVKPRCSEQGIRKGPPEIPRYLSKFFTFVEYLCYPFQSSETPAQRSLLFGTLFFALIVNGLYQSFLVSSLSKPIHYPQLHTLEDVVESGKLVITKYANLKNVFLDESQLDMKLIQRIHVISTRRSTKDIVAYEDKIAITRYYTMELEDFDYYDKEGNPLLYLVDECPMNYRVSYVSRLHSPYAERMDFILLRLREAGLLNFWFESMLYLNRVGKMKKKLDSEDSRNTKLSLDNYTLTFLFLFIGLFGSVLMFFGEVYMAKRNLRKR